MKYVWTILFLLIAGTAGADCDGTYQQFCDLQDKVYELRVKKGTIPEIHKPSATAPAHLHEMYNRLNQERTQLLKELDQQISDYESLMHQFQFILDKCIMNRHFPIA